MEYITELQKLGLTKVKKKSSEQAIASCPFHKDKTPSFSFHLEKGLFHCFSCVMGDSQILSDKGIKRVDEILVGDKILGRNGKFNKVLNVIKSKKQKKLTFTFHKKNNGLSVTPEHKMMIVEGVARKYPPTKNDWDKIAKNNLIECRAQDVKKGSFMLVPKLRLSSIKLWDISKYLIRRSLCGKDSKNIPNKLKITDDLLWFIGMYIAEGSSSSGDRVCFFSLGNHEMGYAEKLCRIGKEVFGITANIYKKKQSKTISVSFCNVHLTKFLKNACGYLAENKHIPYELLRIKNYSILQGIFDGDDCYTEGYTRLHTVSKELSNQVYHLLVSHNYVPNFYVRQERIDRKLLRHSLSYIVDFSLSGKSRNSIKTKEGILIKVKNIVEETIDDYVYDFTVEGGTFVVDNILVHNCHRQGNFKQLVTLIKGADYYHQNYKPDLSFTFKPHDAEEKKKIDKSNEEIDLKPFNYFHPYILRRFNGDIPLLQKFEIGFARDKEALTIPIRDQEGVLKAVQCRHLKKGTKNSYLQETNKASLLYNLHNCLNFREIIITEGAFDVMRAYQNGYPNIIGLLGSDLSLKQKALINSYFSVLNLALDDDDAGQLGIEKLIENFKDSKKIYLWDLSLVGKKDLGDMTQDEMKMVEKNRILLTNI